ncbi:hypothetical protein AVEN_246889-1 [Araneus ventricosus]|uniref:Uncharacterized protein n=1 Tax=Araneus ventricosus TaxID=182803 RepID=A0A4Y2Q9J9_ARAVE|nr:hypothetical protein AVEN_246889-1 [Araneus ventricosus]
MIRNPVCSLLDVTDQQKIQFYYTLYSLSYPRLAYHLASYARAKMELNHYLKLNDTDPALFAVSDVVQQKIQFITLHNFIKSLRLPAYLAKRR